MQNKSQALRTIFLLTMLDSRNGVERNTDKMTRRGKTWARAAIHDGLLIDILSRLNLSTSNFRQLVLHIKAVM